MSGCCCSPAPPAPYRRPWQTWKGMNRKCWLCVREGGSATAQQAERTERVSPAQPFPVHLQACISTTAPTSSHTARHPPTRCPAAAARPVSVCCVGSRIRMPSSERSPLHAHGAGPRCCVTPSTAACSLLRYLARSTSPPLRKPVVAAGRQPWRPCRRRPEWRPVTQHRCEPLRPPSRRPSNRCALRRCCWQWERCSCPSHSASCSA